MSLIKAAMGSIKALQQSNGFVTESASSDYWYTGRGMATASGQNVTPDTAMRLSTVLACVLIISKSMAALPLKLYRMRADGGQDLASNHPIFDLLYSGPNQWQTAFDFVAMMQAHVELRGNAYAEILPGPRGFADQLIPLNPDYVMVELIDPQTLRYRYSDPYFGGTRIILADEMFHLRGVSTNGYTGLSTIAAAAETIGAGLAAQEYGSRFFANDAKPGMVFEHKEGSKGFRNADEEEKYRDNWQRSQTGENRFKTGVVPLGLSIKELGVKNSDAQFIEARKYTRSEIAALHDVPLYKLGSEDKVASYNSVEQFAIGFVQDCLTPRCKMWEQAIKRDLILDPKVFAKFNLNARLRGDSASRSAYYDKMINDGVMSPNEARGLEDMNPREGGNVYLTPLNMRESGPDAAPTPEPAPVPPAKSSKALALATAAAERCVRKEVAASKGNGGAEFYAAHAQFLMDVLRITREQADAYCQAHIGKPASEWESGAVAQLVEIALGGEL